MDVRARAADYAGLGYAPIPLRARTKEPTCTGWPALPIPFQWVDAGDGANIGLRAGDGIAFLDCDDDKRPGTAEAVKRYLAGLGYYLDDDGAPVVATPSRGRHVYVSFKGGLPGHARLLASDLGAGEFRYGPSSMVVAPPSITDKGGYQLVAGDLRQLPRLEVADVIPILGNQDTGAADDVAAAILATAATGEPGRIGRGTWALLRGDGCDRYPSRSEAEAAIMAGCVNAGLSFGAILGLFQTYPAAGKFTELRAANPARAIGYLRRTWENAVKWTAAHPSEGRKLAFQAVQWAGSRPWPGRTGRTDHVVYLAHALTAYTAGKLEYNLSERDLAERAGIGNDTAHNASRRLADAGLIERVKRTDGFKYAALWRLQSGVILAYPHIQAYEGMLGDCHFGHDAFRQKPRLTKGRRPIDGLQGGLGKTAAELWTLLQEHPMTAAELAERSGRHVSTVYKNLKRMSRILELDTGELLRLVERGDGDTWRAVDGDLDAIAKAIGTAGTGERQKAKHTLERAGRKLAIERQRADDSI